MMFRRCVYATAVPVALSLACASGALAASPKVTIRVEAAKRTLLAPTLVRAPSSGSITRDGATPGSCPADSAQGALSVATHGRWSGKAYTGLGIDDESILGLTANYTDGSYWALFVNDRYSEKGACAIKPAPGEQILFAQVPDKGATEYPIVVKAPTHVVDGHAFTVRTFIYTGKGNATKPVSGVRFDLVRGGDETAKVLRRRSARGMTTFMPSGTGQLALTAVASHEIRSAPFTLDIAKR